MEKYNNERDPSLPEITSVVEFFAMLAREGLMLIDLNQENMLKYKTGNVSLYDRELIKDFLSSAVDPVTGRALFSASAGDRAATWMGSELILPNDLSGRPTELYASFLYNSRMLFESSDFEVLMENMALYQEYERSHNPYDSYATGQPMEAGGIYSNIEWLYSWLPFVGDAQDVTDIGDRLYSGQSVEAYEYFLLGAGLILPGNASQYKKGLEAADSTIRSTKGLIRAANLPTTGKIRYVPPKNLSGKLPKVGNGVADKFGNIWQKGPSRTPGQAFEWDVQLSRKGKAQLGWASRDGTHLNVSLDGKVTHK